MIIKNEKDKIEDDDIFESNTYGLFKVLKYNNCNDIDIEFLCTGYKKKVISKSIRDKSIKDKLKPSINNIAYVGDGDYNSINSAKELKRFNKIIERVADPFINSLICKEWLNFQNFVPWFRENYVEGYEIDKDMKIPGNNVYSPDTCIFIPRELNNLFHLSNTISLITYSKDELHNYWINKNKRCIELCNKYPLFEDIIMNNYNYYYNNYNTGIISENMNHYSVKYLTYKMCNKINIEQKVYNKDKIKVFPIPRGGIMISYLMLKCFKNMKIVENPINADIFVDDLIDSGKTRERYQKKYNKPFYAIIDKRIGIDSFIIFPWEQSDKETPIEDNLERICQYLKGDISIENKQDLAHKLQDVMEKVLETKE